MRARAAVVAAVTASAALASAAPAAAWDNQGHMATAAIAYDALLRSHPDEVRAVVALMAAHPDRARFDRALGTATGAARDRLLFEYMGRWPDDIRRTPYDRPDWHYSVRIVSPPGAVFAFHNGRAEDAFLQQLAVARDPRARPADRAVALCWVMHLVGDMHQPLHAGHWMSLRFPGTDRAGTVAWVRPAPGAAPVELHLFWDRAGDQPGGDVAGSAALADKGEARTPFATVPPPPASPREAFDAWAASSRRLALDDAYDGGRFEGGASPGEAPVLTPAYVARAHDVAAQRVGEAGVRLAQVLATLPLPPTR